MKNWSFRGLSDGRTWHLPAEAFPLGETVVRSVSVLASEWQGCHFFCVRLIPNENYVNMHDYSRDIKTKIKCPMSTFQHFASLIFLMRPLNPFCIRIPTFRKSLLPFFRPLSSASTAQSCIETSCRLISISCSLRSSTRCLLRLNSILSQLAIASLKLATCTHDSCERSFLSRSFAGRTALHDRHSCLRRWSSCFTAIFR
jgi:hypothetical protein